jgi:multiple sugar transport system permease protein
MGYSLPRQKISVLVHPAFWFLLPMVLYLMWWRILPLVHTIYLSFHGWNLIRDKAPSFVGISNYLDLVRDARFHHSLLISFFYMFAATGVEVVLGTLLAVAFDRDLKAKGALRGILILPMFLNPVAVGTIWYILYEPSIGPLNHLAQLLGFEAVNWLGSTTVALWAILIADVWQWTPFIFLLVLSALQGLPETLVEAARIDGASNLTILRRITLPLISSTILVASLLRAMDAFRIFPKIYIMTGGGPGMATESSSMLILKTAFRFFEMGYAATMTIIMLVLLMIMYSLYLRLIRTRATSFY